MTSLTTSQLTQVSALLDARYNQLLAAIRDDLEKSDQQQKVDLTERVPADSGDQASGSSEVDLNLAIIDRHLHELADIEAAKSRKGKPMAIKIAEEISSAATNEGTAVKKRADVHRMAEANRAFAHFAKF